ncbi:MAG: hypothetical protein K5989_06685 [Lachnospiraceae bacterium]|nr:hypothetical protein [Lachnospiraceae bacterium]
MARQMVVHETELTRTVDVEAKNALVSLLVKSRVSYLEKWEKISLFHRREYNGAKEICVIYVNENQRELAQEILEDFRARMISARNRGGDRSESPRKRNREREIEKEEDTPTIKKVRRPAEEKERAYEDAARSSRSLAETEKPVKKKQVKPMSSGKGTKENTLDSSIWREPVISKPAVGLGSSAITMPSQGSNIIHTKYSTRNTEADEDTRQRQKEKIKEKTEEETDILDEEEDDWDVEWDD